MGAGGTRRGLIHSDQTLVSQPIAQQSRAVSHRGQVFKEVLAGCLLSSTDKEGRRHLPAPSHRSEGHLIQRFQLRVANCCPAARIYAECLPSLSCLQGSKRGEWRRRCHSRWSPSSFSLLLYSLRNLPALESETRNDQRWLSALWSVKTDGQGKPSRSPRA